MSLSLLMVVYAAPALFILLAIGAVWRLLRLAPLGRPARIALFVLLMTAGLAPMLGPATIVVACCVPNGLFLLLDAAGLVSWYLHTYQWSLASLAGTGALAFLVAYCVKACEKLGLFLRKMGGRNC